LDIADIEIDGVEKDDKFLVTILDESRNITLFTNIKSDKKYLKFNFALPHLDSLSEELRRKDLFGMGYPYHIQTYGLKYIAVTSDYGLLLFKLSLPL